MINFIDFCNTIFPFYNIKAVNKKEHKKRHELFAHHKI